MEREPSAELELRTQDALLTTVIRYVGIELCLGP